jgi:hypothetical protein
MMKPEYPIAAVDEVLRVISVQLKYADHELRSLTAMIKKTNQAIRSSREALVRTNTLIPPEERSDKR